MSFLVESEAVAVRMIEGNLVPRALLSAEKSPGNDVGVISPCLRQQSWYVLNSKVCGMTSKQQPSAWKTASNLSTSVHRIQLNVCYPFGPKRSGEHCEYVY